MIEPGIQMRTTLIQATLNVILSLALVIKFGFYGAVVGTTVSMMIGSVLLFQWYGKRLMESPSTTLMQVISKPTLCVIPSAVIGSIAVGVSQDLLQLHSRIERGALLLAVALVFFFLYGFIVIRSKTVSSDDREFVDGVLPERFKYLMKFF
jgi:peptidoglycan biosynthesis protein MviN/MurJ (putative lipid II flippase)